MRSSVALCVILLFAGCSLLHPPRTSIDYSKPFEATYTADLGGTKGMMHIASDGRGHVRFDCPWSGSYDSSQSATTSFSMQPMQIQGSFGTSWVPVDILDVNSHEVIEWIKGSGLNFYTRSPMSDHSHIDSTPVGPIQMLMRFLENPSVNRKSAQPLGSETINGRPCHGFKTRQLMFQQHTIGIGSHRTTSTRTMEGNWQKEWVDDDIGILVKCDSEEAGMFGPTHIELTEFSDKAADPSVFQPPKGYSEGAPADGNMAFSGSMNLSISGGPSSNPSMSGPSGINMSVSIGKTPDGSTKQSDQKAPSSFGIKLGATNEPKTAMAQPSTSPTNSQPPEPVVETKPLRQLTDVVAKEGDFLSTLSGFTNAEIDNYMVRYQDTGSPEHAKRGYSIVAPKDWHSTIVRAPARSFGKIEGKYWQLLELDGKSPHTSLEIWYSKPSADETLSLTAFLDNFTKAMGMTIVQKKESADRIDALAQYDFPKIGKMTARIACLQLDGKRIWMAAGCSPKSDFPRFSNIFCVAATTFSPVGYNPPFHPDIAAKDVAGTAPEE